jgi:Flp pilus assembly protein TadD
MPARTESPPAARLDTGPRFTFQPGKGNPAYRDARLRRINAHLDAEEFESAEQLLARHLKDQPNDPEALASLAIALAAGRGRLQSGRKAARKAIALAPRCAAGYFALGYVYLLGSRIEPGFRFLMKAREIDPNDPRVELGLRRCDDLRPPVISDLDASNRLNRSLGRIRGAIFRQRRAAALLGVLVVALIGICACAGVPG